MGIDERPELGCARCEAADVRRGGHRRRARALEQQRGLAEEVPGVEPADLRFLLG